MNSITAKEANEISNDIGQHVLEDVLYECMEKVYEEIRKAAKNHLKKITFGVVGVTPKKKFLGIPIPGTREILPDSVLSLVVDKMVTILKEDGYDAWKDNIIRTNGNATLMQIHINWIKVD